MATATCSPLPARRAHRRPAEAAAGLALVGAVVAAGFAGSRLTPFAGPLLWATALGVLLAPLAGAATATAPGVRLAATRLLRVGVALLGLHVSLGDLARVGWTGVLIAAATITVTMGLTLRLGRRLRVRPELTLLIATGSAICGASAIAAMDAAIGRARQEDIGYAVATVTLFGTAAMLALPPLAALLGLDDLQAGMWAGASIHEVAQATAAGAMVSAGALHVATLVKLCRVVMLAPVVALAGLGAGRRAKAGARPEVPRFVLAFLALVAVRSLGVLPDGVLAVASTVSTVLLAAGLAGLGLGVRLGALRADGVRPLAVGLAAWGIAAATGLALVVTLT